MLLIQAHQTFLCQATCPRVPLRMQSMTFPVSFLIRLANNLSALCVQKYFSILLFLSVDTLFVDVASMTAAIKCCPIDGTGLVIVTSNLAVSEQVSQLEILCRYGLTEAEVSDPNGKLDTKNSV